MNNSSENKDKSNPETGGFAPKSTGSFSNPAWDDLPVPAWLGTGPLQDPGAPRPQERTDSTNTNTNANPTFQPDPNQNHRTGTTTGLMRIQRENGENLLREHRYSEAIASFSEIIQLLPGVIWSYTNRVYAYFAIHEYAKAIADLDEIIRLQPDSAWADRKSVV